MRLASLIALFAASPLLLLADAPRADAACSTQGGPKRVPYGEAVQEARQAAEAVLARSGDEACLRGKLSNAMLLMSASCEASGEATPLCQLADSLAVRLQPLSLNEMDARAEEILGISAP
ncbi:hypothetical protein EVJ50_12760 [Synechococcus sp. RSCCF101]|uniref:hypothetical protein n=1 Tax=Synechococcus sp. RSCCF101 TaxID=2511069 RepID=UPI001246C420|nr:hypothetical protein [Synechococcus sp. RSCCF101]QEY32968.1 hypothetical protein EVJ50_12760 [Synechococcus sp. RSCCF101]